MSENLKTKYKQSRIIGEFIAKLIPEKMLEDMIEEVTERVMIAALHQIATGKNTHLIVQVTFDKDTDENTQYVDGFSVKYNEDISEFFEQNDMSEVLKIATPTIMTTVAKRAQYEQEIEEDRLGQILSSFFGCDCDNDEGENTEEAQPANDEQKPSEQVAS